MENPTHIVLVYDNPSQVGGVPQTEMRKHRQMGDGFQSICGSSQSSFLLLGWILYIYIYIY